MLKIYHSSFDSDFKLANGAIDGTHFVATDVETSTEYFRWPVHRIQATQAGSSRDLYKLECPEVTDHTAFTRDSTLLQHLPQLSHISKTNGSSFWPWLIVLVAFGLILGGYFLWTSQKENWSQLVSQSIPLEWEIKLGEVLANQMMGVKSRQYATQSQDLEKLLEPLLAQAEKRYQHNIQIYIINDPTPNAFALPGGHVGFHVGLLTKATSLEMIYGVAAHEFAHVLERHSLRSVVGGLSLFVLAQFLFGDFTGLLAVLVDNSQLLLQQMYSREAEAEADRVGVELLGAIQLSSRGLYQFFELLESKNPNGDSPMSDALSFLSTHPPTKERMEQMRARIDSTKNWLDTDEQKQNKWRELQSSLKL